MINREATGANILIVDLIRPGFELPTFRTRNERSTHLDRGGWYVRK